MKKLLLLFFVLITTFANAQWQSITTGLSGISVNDLYEYDGAIYASTSGGLFKSTDNAATWTRIGLDIIPQAFEKVEVINDTIYTMTEVPSRASQNTPNFLGNGRLWMSVDEGISFQAPNVPQTTFSLLNFIGFNGGLVLSTESGQFGNVVTTAYGLPEPAASNFLFNINASMAGLNSTVVNDTLFLEGPFGGLGEIAISGPDGPQENAPSYFFPGLTDFNIRCEAATRLDDGVYAIRRSGGQSIFSKGILTGVDGSGNNLWAFDDLYSMPELPFNQLNISSAYRASNYEVEACIKKYGSKMLVGFYGIRTIYSEDNGATWTSLTDPEGHPYKVTDYIISGGVEFIATADRGILRKQGTNWISANSGINTVDIKFIETFGDAVYAANSAGLFRLNPAGSWQELTVTLADKNISAFGVVGNSILVKNDLGLFYSANQGISWEAFSSPLITPGDLIAITASDQFYIHSQSPVSFDIIAGYNPVTNTHTLVNDENSDGVADINVLDRIRQIGNGFAAAGQSDPGMMVEKNFLFKSGTNPVNYKDPATQIPYSYYDYQVQTFTRIGSNIARVGWPWTAGNPNDWFYPFARLERYAPDGTRLTDVKLGVVPAMQNAVVDVKCAYGSGAVAVFGSEYEGVFICPDINSYIVDFFTGDTIVSVSRQNEGLISLSISDLTIAGDKIYASAGGYIYELGFVSLGLEDYSGTVFLDANMNGEIDSTDIPVEGALLQSNSGAYGFTDENGQFSFTGSTINSESDTIRLISQYPGTSFLPEYYLVDTATAGGLNFLIVPQSTDPDVAVYGSGSQFIVGQQASVSISLINGVIPSSGQLKFVEVSGLIDFVSSVPAPDAQSGDTLIWDFQNLTPLTNQQFTVNYQVPPNPDLLGEEVYFYAYTSADAEINFENNTATFHATITSSVDPNEKVVTPSEGLVQEEIDEGKKLMYTLNFQNTGTAVAFNIVVADTLDAWLDITTLQVLDASHPFTYRLNEGRELEFTFDNILLPDSTSNEPESHGWVNFVIAPYPGFAIGNHIDNTGFIYFDFNDAVVTNTVTTNVIIPLGAPAKHTEASFSIQPNPAREYIRILYSGGEAFKKAEMMNLAGQIVSSANVANGSVISTGDLASGVYMLRLSGKNGTEVKRLVISK